MNNNKPAAFINKKNLKEILGQKFLAHMLGLLDGMNRLTSLWDFLVLNYDLDNASNDIRFKRNFTNGVVLSMGILWEIYHKIIDISKTKIVQQNVKIRDKIDDLIKFYGKSYQIDLLRNFRNQLSFHIDHCNICQGIDEIDKDDVRFIVCDKKTRTVDCNYEFAQEASLSGFIRDNKILFFQLLDLKDLSGTLDDEFIEKALDKLMSYLRKLHEDLMLNIEELIILIVGEFKLETITKTVQ